MIEVRQLTKSFGPFSAVKSIDFTIQKGEIVGLLGPNGAGKTTTMRMITGYYYPTSGDVLVDSTSIKAEKQEVQKRIGYLPEAASAYHDMTVAEYLDFIADARKLEDQEKSRGIDYAVSATGLQVYYYRPIAHLSKGYKQRVGLAASLIHNPDILILDEPTSGLDPNQIVEIQNLIMKLASEKTIILSTHILKEVEDTCQRAIIINNGEIVLDESLEQLSRAKEGIATFTVGFKGNAGDAAEKLRSISSASDVRSVNSTDGNSRFMLSADQNAAEQIFRMAVEQQLVLTELTPKKQSLEEVFHSLTRGK